MTSTNPYFIRHMQGDTPGNNGGTWSACPDIVLSTTGYPDYTPVSTDPNGLITAASYATTYPAYVQVSQSGTDNYVYLRALNTAPTPPVATRLWLFYTQSNMAMWPQKWQSAGIRVNNITRAQNWQDTTWLTSGGPGPYIVTNQPFIWSAQSPDAGQHYCLISMAEPFPNADPPGSLSDPPFAPPSSIGYLSSFDQLTQFVLQNDWFGWLNTTDVTSFGTTWQQTIPITGPDEAGQVYVGIACSNMPTDGYVSATMIGPDAANSLNMPRTPITTGNMNYTVPINWPANFSTTMVISYWQGPTVPPYMATIAPVLTQTASAAQRLMGDTPITRRPMLMQARHNTSHDLLGWRKMHVFGSCPLSWQTPPPTLRGYVNLPHALAAVPDAARDPHANWQKSWPISAPGDGSQFYAGLQCTNMPTDGQVELRIVPPPGSQGADTGAVPITTPNMALMVPLQWPASADGTLVISYWQGATPPPAGAAIAPVLLDPATPATSQRNDASPDIVEDLAVVGPPGGGAVYVGLRCVGMPTDGFVGFSLSAPTPPPGAPQPLPLVTMPESIITNPDMELYAHVVLPPAFAGTLTLLFWKGGTAPGRGASMQGIVMLADGSTSTLERQR